MPNSFLFASFFLIQLIYGIFCLLLLLVWLKRPIDATEKNYQPSTFFSVIIPIRNEEKNIVSLLQDLENQQYTKKLYEIIIADDASTDSSVLLVENFKKSAKSTIKILSLKDIDRNASPKKRAITFAVQHAEGELISTTDGDCRVGEHWLMSLAQVYEKHQPALISGGVTFFDEINEKASWGLQIWNKMQIIEFASLVGTAASSIFMNKPNMCSGANLTYRKSAFYEVEGFKGNENLASGDDEFLMHKMAKKYPNGIYFVKNQDAIVETQAHESLKSFYFQRKRWASKWKHYSSWQPTALAIFIFLSNFTFLATFVLFLFGNISFQNFLCFYFIKTGFEGILLVKFCSFLKKKNVAFLIPFVQIVYPIYVVFFGLIVQGKTNYLWKGRKLE